MTAPPARQDLEDALAAAGTAHHEYEQNLLGGKRDEQWPGWYAAYVLGRLGDFASPTSITRWRRELLRGAKGEGGELGATTLARPPSSVTTNQSFSAPL